MQPAVGIRRGVIRPLPRLGPREFTDSTAHDTGRNIEARISLDLEPENAVKKKDG